MQKAYVRVEGAPEGNETVGIVDRLDHRANAESAGRERGSAILDALLLRMRDKPSTASEASVAYPVLRGQA